MEKKIYIFRNPEWAQAKKIFTHYWTNEGENFFDTVWQVTDLYGRHIEYETTEGDIGALYNYNPTEAYLQRFKDVGYDWYELPVTRYQRESISEISVQMDVSDFDENPTLFFKIVNVDEHGIETDIPLYYYSTGITEVSDQNYNSTSYTVKCTLDMWATYWCRMHSIMKKCPTQVDFMQKMANRFIFNEQFNEDGTRKESQGFIIDYLKQPYLMRTNNYPQNLIVNDDRENFLSLEEWLFINSGKKDSSTLETWVQQVWLNWLKQPYAGLFKPDAEFVSDIKSSFNIEDVNKAQNVYAKLLPSFYDTDFNSNTKYRYLACRVGNNTSPNKKEIEGGSYAKGMFKNFTFNTNKCIPTVKVTPNPSIFDTNEWTEDHPYSFSWYKKAALEGVDLSTGAIAIAWDDFLVNEKALTMHFNSDRIIEEKHYINDYFVTWTDDLQLKSHRLVLNNFQYNKEYSILDIPTKSYVFDIYGDYINVSLSINIVFSDAAHGELVFRVKFDKNYDELVFPDTTITTKLRDPITINQFYVSKDFTTSPVTKEVDGETIMLVPFKKGDEEREYIKLLNTTDKGILLGDGSLLGMPVNDIPPSVLAQAIRRQNDASDLQTLGDMLSIRGAQSVRCPLDIVDLVIDGKDMPVLFSSFDNIPITVATAPLQDDIYQCVGGNKFFNYLFDLLTNDYLSGNTQVYDWEKEEWYTHGGNVIEAEPFLYGPQFWKWSYFIDGNHFIELTADKIDFYKLLLDDWEVKLNVSINAGTGYFLDISEIKNNKYPMTKLGAEMISGDPSCFPFTTEAYNNYYQQNQLQQETSKNANQIANDYAREASRINASATVAASIAEGAAQGMSGGGFLKMGAGAAAGAALGLVAGTAKATAIRLGTENAIRQANEEWANKWRGELGNYYTSPSKLNPDGFSTGSLVYSIIKNANQNSYELFRTFSLSDIDRQKVWYDISMNGYPYLSQCKYADYNNRVNFNIVNCNLFDKYYFTSNFIQSAMFKISPLLSQGDAIAAFMDKCKSKIRLFKCIYNEEDMDNIVSTNIELAREWCSPYFAPKKALIFETALFDKDYQDDSWVWSDKYEWDSVHKNVLTKKGTTSKQVKIPMIDLGVTSLTEFKEKYEAIQLGNKNSYGMALINDEGRYDFIISSNSSEFGPEGISTNVLAGDLDSIPAHSALSEAVIAYKGSTFYSPKSYNLGWGVNVTNDETNIIFTVSPYSKWTFEDGLDLSDYSVKNWAKEYSKSVSFSSSDLDSDKFVGDRSLEFRFNPKEVRYDGYYSGGTWKGNGYHQYNAEDPMRWAGRLYKGETISKRYDQLGIKNVHDRQSFLEKFTSMDIDLSKFELYYKVYYQEDMWDKIVRPTKIIINKSDLPSSGTKTISFNVMGINDSSSLNNINLDGEESWKQLNGEITILNTRQYFIQGKAKFNFTIDLEITLDNEMFSITPSYKNNFFIYTSQHEEGERQGFNIKNNNNEHNLNWKIGINSYKLNFNGQDVTSKWFMENKLNQIVVLKKDKIDQFTNSYIFRTKKKEG